MMPNKSNEIEKWMPVALSLGLMGKFIRQSLQKQSIGFGNSEYLVFNLKMQPTDILPAQIRVDVFIAK